MPDQTSHPLTLVRRRGNVRTFDSLSRFPRWRRVTRQPPLEFVALELRGPTFPIEIGPFAQATWEVEPPQHRRALLQVRVTTALNAHVRSQVVWIGSERPWWSRYEPLRRLLR